MYKNAVAADRIETEPEKEFKEQKTFVLPKRCKSCEDLAICDLDFCLHWWH